MNNDFFHDGRNFEGETTPKNLLHTKVGESYAPCKPKSRPSRRARELVLWHLVGESLRDSSQVGCRRPVHGVSIKSDEPTIVFLTVCTKDRTPRLFESGVHESFADIWQKSRCLAYWVLSTHAGPHSFVSTPAGHATHAHRVGSFLEKQLHSCRLAQGRDWQRDYWDTLLRRSKNSTEKWKHIQQNPVRKGLAKTPEDRSHRGHLNHLQWQWEGRVPARPLIQKNGGKVELASPDSWAGLRWRPARHNLVTEGTKPPELLG